MGKLTRGDLSEVSYITSYISSRYQDWSKDKI